MAGLIRKETYLQGLSQVAARWIVFTATSHNLKSSHRRLNWVQSHTSPNGLIAAFLVQGCVTGAASECEESKLNASSKYRGGIAEPPIPWV